MQSGLASKATVVVGGDNANTAPFGELSKSGKMVNAFNALLLADSIVRGKATLENNTK